jgi:hypothetical protein
MVDISLNHGDSVPPVINLSHPSPVSWSSIIGHVAEQLSVALVPYTEWLHALEDNLKDKTKTEVEHMQETPALRLLSVFQQRVSSSVPPRSMLRTKFWVWF